MEEHQKEEHGYICSVCQHKCSEWGALKDHTLQEHGGYLTSESNAGLMTYLNSKLLQIGSVLVSSSLKIVKINEEGRKNLGKIFISAFMQLCNFFVFKLTKFDQYYVLEAFGNWLAEIVR